MEFYQVTSSGGGHQVELVANTVKEKGVTETDTKAWKEEAANFGKQLVAVATRSRQGICIRALISILEP